MKNTLTDLNNYLFEALERLDILAAVSQAKRDAKAGELPVVFHRKNNCEWLATMPVEVFFKLYAGYGEDKV